MFPYFITAGPCVPGEHNMLPPARRSQQVLQLIEERKYFTEAGPHLMRMAFLQRVVNSGGRIEREYGLGRGALDLMILGLGHEPGHFDYLCPRSRHSREGGNPANSATSATSGPPPSRG